MYPYKNHNKLGM